MDLDLLEEQHMLLTIDPSLQVLQPQQTFREVGVCPPLDSHTHITQPLPASFKISLLGIAGDSIQMERLFCPDFSEWAKHIRANSGPGQQRHWSSGPCDRMGVQLFQAQLTKSNQHDSNFIKISTQLAIGQQR